jgi:Mn2+/Fe2+ NRAMP family transporter
MQLRENERLARKGRAMILRTNRWLKQLGPGLITGAADDDPSGIATYSQAGAQFGYQLGWTLVLTYPLMVGIQMVSARMGRVTGHGLASNIRLHFPRPVLYAVVAMLVVANTINIAADIAAMGEALRLVAGGPMLVYAIAFGVLCLGLQVFLRYQVYVRYLKWLTLALLAYVAVVFTIAVPWREVVQGLLWPRVALNAQALTVIVAVFGTTISPYLFFWQAAQEVEELNADPVATAPVPQPDQDRHVFRNGILQPDRTVHHHKLRGDAAQEWNHRHLDVGAGRGGAAAARRRRGVSVVQPRYHRHRFAGRSGARRIGRVCGRGGL